MNINNVEGSVVVFYLYVLFVSRTLFGSINSGVWCVVKWEYYLCNTANITQ